jgi:hypothetical protein
MEEFTPRPVGPLIGVGAEIVTLGLQKISRQFFGAVPVEIGQGGRKRRYGNSVGYRSGNNPAPAFLALFHFFNKERIEQEICEAMNLIKPTG